MKVLLVTSVFENQDTGPGKFANILFNSDANEIKYFILTNDFKSIHPNVFNLKLAKSKGLFYYFKLKYKFYLEIKKLNKQYNFNYILYNNIQDSLFSLFFVRDVQHVGMINDDNSACISIKDILRDFSRKKYLFFYFVEYLLSIYIDFIIVNSDYLSNVLNKRYNINRKKIFRLYKSIEITDDRLNNKSIDILNEIDVLFVKSDFIRGGLEYLIQSLNDFPYKINLFIVGPNEFDYNNFISNFKINTNLRIYYLNKQTQSQVKDLMLNSHIFCTPSIKEALGVANIEALSLKTPVVFTKCGGIVEVFNNDECGFPCLPENVNSLRAALLSCILNSEERKIKVEAGYLRVKNYFQSSLMLNNLKLFFLDHE
jgi:colanic acid/amylovoran biosynthesis glycosyltransferase